MHIQSVHDDQVAYNNTYATPLSSTKFSRCRYSHFAHDKAPMLLHRLPLPYETLMPGRCQRHFQYDAPLHKIFVCEVNATVGFALTIIVTTVAAITQLLTVCVT